jgi:hypothetical protein
MPAKNRLSISFSDIEFAALERLAAHTQKSKAEVVRIIFKEFVRDNPDRFRRETSVGLHRDQNIIGDIE